MDEEEDDSWIPLTPTATAEESSSSAADDNGTVPEPHTRGSITNMHTSAAGRSQSSRGRSSAGTSTSNRTAHQQQQDTRNLQQRLEARIRLKSNLVDHPIDLFWKRYLVNLAQEVWALEWHIRLGLCMLILGITTKVFLLSTWYFWYPRFVLVTMLLVAATLYLDVFGFQQQFDNLGKLLVSPETVLQLIQQLDSTGIRRLAVVLLLIPTGLEMRTLSFLSGIKAETGWSLYNLLLSSSLLGLMMYWFRVQHIKPRECLYRGLLLLYGSALWVTIYTTNLSRLPILAAPFLTATGTIMITYQDDDMEWVSRVLRHALRLALRDVLSSMGEKVTEDEMLQLAILRWIADYWASAPTTSAPDSSSSSSERPAAHQSAPSRTSGTAASAAGSAGSTSSSGSATGRASGSSTPTPFPQTSSFTGSQRRSASAIFQRRHDVSWEELLPMLNVATEHMTSEVQMLQSNPQTMGAVPNFGTPPRRTTEPSTGPIDSFHDMLRALNVDERAEPAVRAYKRAVESFPPSQQMAVLLSILRRCPAFLTILFHIVMVKPGVLSSTMVLLPFVVMEYHRIMAWLHCCEQVKVYFDTVEEPEGSTSDNSRKFIPSALRDADPMVILLVGDSYNPLRPPALLLVWRNVANSVSALEVGLTAARCAETTAVAVQFAGNVMSLVQFGQEIHEHGLLHGLLVMGKEAILMHTMDESVRDRESTKYTHAVMGAMENAQRVARNVQTLAHDDKIGHVIQPVVWAACSLSGYGWLWGRETPPDASSSSSEEMTNDRATSVPQESWATEKKSMDETPEDQASSGATSPDIAQTGTIPEGLDQLSDLMEEIVETYGDGQVNEAQKDELCERLSHVSGTDSSAVRDIKKALAEFVKKNEKSKEPPSADENKERVRSSAVVEMVLAAYYRGLIDQTEKAAFCQRVANLSDEERTDPAVVGGMIRTLTAILEQGHTIDETTVVENSSHQVEGHEKTKDRIIIENEEASHSRAAEAVAMDEIPTTSASEIPSFAQQADGEQSHNEQQPLYGTAPNTTSDAETRPSTQSRENPHDGLVRLGMATLSFVVGGVLLSRNGANDEQQEQRSDQGSQDSASRNETTGIGGSTVQIEEIEDDVEEEWVSVPQ